VPVVATRVGNLPALVDHGRTGFLSDCHPEALSRTLVQALSSPSLKTIAGQARKSPFVLRSYGTMAREIEELSQNALREPRS
jgi:glycosyltransferase involved in cell wall biosynthesis